jgi:hypothetical protein
MAAEARLDRAFRLVFRTFVSLRSSSWRDLSKLRILRSAEDDNSLFGRCVPPTQANGGLEWATRRSLMIVMCERLNLRKARRN